MKKINKKHNYIVSVDIAQDNINDAINVYMIENGSIKMWEKIKLNSDYRALANNICTFYDPVKVQEITNTGKKYLQELKEKLKENGL